MGRAEESALENSGEGRSLQAGKGGVRDISGCLVAERASLGDQKEIKHLESLDVVTVRNWRAGKDRLVGGAEEGEVETRPALQPPWLTPAVWAA